MSYIIKSGFPPRYIIVSKSMANIKYAKESPCQTALSNLKGLMHNLAGSA